MRIVISAMSVGLLSHASSAWRQPSAHQVPAAFARFLHGKTTALSVTPKACPPKLTGASRKVYRVALL